MGEVELYLVQRKYTGQDWYLVTTYPYGWSPGLRLDLGGARELLQAWQDRDNQPGGLPGIVGPVEYRIIKVRLPFEEVMS